jgi:LacI family transcriptional regulator
MVSGRRSVTIRHVAEKAGVSIATVSYVLSGTKKISPATENRVLSAVEELGYLPNRLARNLKMRTNTTIGILVADIRNPFFPSIVEFVSKYLAQEGYGIFVASSDESVEEQARILKRFLEHQIAGLIAIPTGSPEEIYPEFERLMQAIPLILLDRDIPNLNCGKVILDNARGTRELTSHLIEAGHRRIAIVTPPLGISIGTERLQGYAQALAESGIEVEERLRFEGNLFEDSGERAADYFLDFLGEERPTAVVSCNEMMTIGFMKRIRERGARIPRDFSLVSFDDPDHLALLDPPITAYSQPERSFGQKAAEMLTKELRSVPVGERRVILQGQLMRRESVRGLR